jgi:hypothetical protein
VGREILSETRQAAAANDHNVIPAIFERIRELPPGGQREILELNDLLLLGAEAELSHLKAGAAAAEGAKHVLLAARDKLEAEGKPVDPNMTVAGAYEVLGR